MKHRHQKPSFCRLSLPFVFAACFGLACWFPALCGGTDARAAVPQGEDAETVDSGLDYRESTAELNNPDRGFYKALSAKLSATVSLPLWSVDGLRSYTADFGLLHLRIGLEAFSSNGPLAVGNQTVTSRGQDGPISAAALQCLRGTLENLRAAGGTAIVRFSYNVNGDQEKTETGTRYVPGEPSAGLSLIEQHIAQLGQVLTSFGDVIAGVETGMLGPWGEQHSTPLAAANNADVYFRLGEAWLKAAPAGKGITFRRPLYFIHWANKRYGLQLTEATLGAQAEAIEAEGGDLVRVGCYNDGYLGSASDLGTFDSQNRASVTQWLTRQAQTTLYGGEAVADADTGLMGPYNKGSYLAQEGFSTHTSYLNIDWNNRVVGVWKDTPYGGTDQAYSGESEYTYLANHLGYRLVLRSSRLSASVGQGGALRLTGNIENVGFGNVVNAKTAYLFLIKADDAQVRYSAALPFEVSGIRSRTAADYRFLMRIPSTAPTGAYRVLIRFADPAEPTDSTARGIRLANVGNRYEYGANELGSVTITADASAGNFPDFEPIDESAPQTVSVTYEGGVGAQGTPPRPMTAAVGAQLTLPENPFTRAHYTFLGWSDGANVYAAGEAYRLGNRDVTFTALWRAERYRVQFDGNGGTLKKGEEVQLVGYGEAAVAPEYRRDGYRFDGWDTAFDAVACDLTVRALWKESSTETPSLPPAAKRGCGGSAGASGSIGGATALLLVAKGLLGKRRTRE